MKEKFKIVYEGLVNSDFLSQEEAKTKAIERWGQNVGSREPSFFPSQNDKIKLFELIPKRAIHSVEYMEVAKRNKLFFPNATGLVLLENLDIIYDFIPDGAFVLGIDEKHHLHLEKHSGHAIPVLHKIGDKYVYMFFPWNMNLDHDDYLLLFEKG